jgi:hypothetical protein
MDLWLDSAPGYHPRHGHVLSGARRRVLMGGFLSESIAPSSAAGGTSKTA